MRIVPTAATRGRIETEGSGNGVTRPPLRDRVVISLIVLGLAALPATAQDRTLIVNKTKESIWYAKAVWVKGKNDSGLAFEPTNYYDISGWYEVKPGETKKVDWLPFLRIDKGGKPVVLKDATSEERSFPMHPENEFDLPGVDESIANTKAALPKDKKGFVMGRGFFEYRHGVATVTPDSPTLDAGEFKVKVGPGAQQVPGKPKEPAGNVTYEISVTIANETRYDVSFTTIGVRDKTSRRLKPKAAQTYTIEVEAPKGATIEIVQAKGSPTVYTVPKDGSFVLREHSSGEIILDSPSEKAPAGGLKVGDAVWAEWKPNDWYKAKITKKTSKGFQVVYDDDGATGEVGPKQVALDVVPDKGQVKDGTRVLAKWTDGKFYPGRAGAAKADGSYAVTFDDGDKANVKLKDIRVMIAP